MNSRSGNRKPIWLLALLVCFAAALTAGRSAPAPDDPPQYSDWSAPVNLGPIVNWPDKSDQQASVSKDGLSLYFASGRPGGFSPLCGTGAPGACDFDIWVSQRASVDDPWGPPQNVGASINTSSREFFPVLSSDGHRLYFASNRPGGLGEMDVYVSRRHNKRDDFGWQPAENLGSVVNTAAVDSPTSYFEDDVTGAITLYLQSNRPGGMGRSDIYASTLQPDEAFGTPVVVVELSSPFDDQGPAIRRDGLEMFLASNRPGSLAGSLDLWVSTRTSTLYPWSPPVHLGPVVNSVVIENRPALSFDGTELYFTSTRLGSRDPQDLWVSTRTKLKGQD